MGMKRALLAGAVLALLSGAAQARAQLEKL